MTVFRRYGEVLEEPGTALALTVSVIGRLSLGMTGFGLLLLVRETSGSYAVAGLVAGVYAAAFAVLSPSRARAADRTGPVRVLRLTGLLHPLALVALAGLAVAGAPSAVLLLPAVAAGATVPPLSAVMRALWASLLEGPRLATAYSLEAVVVELCFLLGPLATAGLVVLAGPAAAVVGSAVATLVGAVWLASCGVVRRVEPHEERAASRFGPLAAPAVRALLVTVFAIGLGFGAVEVALPAYSEDAGRTAALAGVLLAVWSAGSVLGGLVYGGLQLRAPARRQLPLLTAALALGTALPVLAAPFGPAAVGAGLFLYGLTIAPFSACNAVLLGGAAPPGTATEAFAWNSSSIFGGAAVGSGLAGVLAERVSPTAALGLTTAAGLLALVSAAASAFRLRTGPSRTV